MSGSNGSARYRITIEVVLRESNLYRYLRDYVMEYIRNYLTWPGELICDSVTIERVDK